MLRQRSLSAVELAGEHIREIERLDPSLHAFSHFDPERLLLAAKDADSRIAGAATPLLGLPMTVKASIATSGYRCELGSLLNQGSVATEDAVVVQRMKAAGATILGTTNCSEFLMAYETDNLLYGKTANPWNLAHSAGGSSGGEAAAIASGLSAGGIGSDSGGSVRLPAHFTGICSFKPTPGRLPSRGHLPPGGGPFSLLGSVGPMARTMTDVSFFFEVLSGRDVLDPAGTPLVFRKMADAELRTKPIAVLEDDGLVPVTEETRAAVRSAARALKSRGFAVETFHSASLEAARRLWWAFFIRCGRMLLEPLIRGREEQLSSTFRYFLEAARSEPILSGDELLEAWTDSDVVRSKLLEELAPYAALITPVSSIPAFRHGEREWIVEGRRLEYFNAMRFTQWFNLLGAPAASVPVGRSGDGLPIGVQVAARPYEDESVLKIATLLDEDFGYVAPPMAVLVG
ncbi:Aspartyl-tRNA(Asn) amidotransferase subunit A [Acidisarcina polymorpha]|uniref:Aspartyl-tRNA(Asn) amidotransferase subunit A n=2 Tax=Acidisarcina polymorpha TaxID=2211140 RepID=A0A2Z5FSR9_9BACT|nr:Aspartyl-tRNA(Asn) amidotransferase subunit A [Acidisarcina polymorpha]